MQIELNVPDDIVQALHADDLPRVLLEALALEGYRARRLGNGQLRQLLGFETPMQVDAFLKEHDVYLNYSVEDFEKDIENLDRLRSERDLQDKRPA